MYLGTYLGNSIVRRTLLGILYCLYCIVRTIQYVYSRLFDDDGPSPRGGMRRTPVRAHGQRSSGNGLHSPRRGLARRWRRPSCWEKKNGERQDPGMRLDLGSENTEIERPVACPRLCRRLSLPSADASKRRPTASMAAWMLASTLASMAGSTLIKPNPAAKIAC